MTKQSTSEDTSHPRDDLKKITGDPTEVGEPVRPTRVECDGRT